MKSLPEKLTSFHNENPTLWRYMSLDKFVHLLSTKSLFFTGLGNYSKSDPCGGSVPRELLERCVDFHFDQYMSQDGLRDKNLKEETIIQLRNATKMRVVGTMQCWAVSCWHCNENESEAMWKLYSDTGKGIAIKTDFLSLITNFKNVKSGVNFDKVHYVNMKDYTFEDKHIGDDHIPYPLFKSESFSHENEFRFFIQSQYAKYLGGQEKEIELNNFWPFIKPAVEAAKLESRFVECDPLSFIKEVYISPYSSEPFDSAVRDICKQYNLNVKVEKSPMLEGIYDYDGEDAF